MSGLLEAQERKFQEDAAMIIRRMEQAIEDVRSRLATPMNDRDDFLLSYSAQAAQIAGIVSELMSSCHLNFLFSSAAAADRTIRRAAKELG